MAGLVWHNDLTHLTDAADLAHSLHSGHLNFLEIGCNRGRTSKAICKHLLKKNVSYTYYGIDPQVPFPGGRKWKLEFNGQHFVWLKGFSFEKKILNKVPHEIHWAFVDGCHCQICVKRDITLYLPKMVHNGVMCFHDASPVTQGQDSQDYKDLAGQHNSRLARTKGIQVLEVLDSSIIAPYLYRKAQPNKKGGVATYVVRFK